MSVLKSIFDNNTHYFLSYVIQGYSNTPSESDREKYKLFLETVIDVLRSGIPYNETLKTYLSKNPLNYTVISNKTNLFKWFVGITSDMVDTKLNVSVDNIDPKLWGKTAWAYLYDLISTYNEPYTDEKKQKYKTILTYLQYVLPCSECRHNYTIELSTNPINEDVLFNRFTLNAWYGRMKNNINNKILRNRHIKNVTYIPELVGSTFYNHSDMKMNTLLKTLKSSDTLRIPEIKKAPEVKKVPEIKKISETKQPVETKQPYVHNAYSQPVYKTYTTQSKNNSYTATPIQSNSLKYPNQTATYTSTTSPYSNLKKNTTGGCKCGGKK